MCHTDNEIVREPQLSAVNIHFILFWQFSIYLYSLPISVGALYVRKYFDEESKKAAVDLVNNIQEEYVNILRKVSWMDDGTRAEAIEKAKSMTSHIAYPDELIDNNKLEEYYQGLELEPDSLLQNVLRVRTFKDVHLIKKLRQPVNKTDWEAHTMPATVNAAYSPLENSIRELFTCVRLIQIKTTQIFELFLLFMIRIARCDSSRSVLFSR